MIVRERYLATPVGANGTAVLNGEGLGGFLCTVSGTINVTNADGVPIVVNLPVTAGIYYPLPFQFGGAGSGSLVCSGGAAGTVAS